MEGYFFFEKYLVFCYKKIKKKNIYINIYKIKGENEHRTLKDCPVQNRSVEIKVGHSML